MDEQEIPFWDYKNKDAIDDNILPIDFLEKAAQEMLDSKWGKQTPKIADTLANKMRSAS